MHAIDVFIREEFDAKWREVTVAPMILIKRRVTNGNDFPIACVETQRAR